MTKESLPPSFELKMAGRPAADPNKPAAQSLAPEELAQLIASAAWDKKAKNLVALNVREIAGYADIFILCSGTSDRHVSAIARGVEDKLRTDYRIKPFSAEGLREGRWVILDFEDVVLHVQQEPVREFYALDKLWSDAPAVDIQEPAWLADDPFTD